MGRELLERSPEFAAELRACGRALSGYVEWDLEEVLRGSAGAPALERVDVVQPALWAVMVSLAGVWRSCGVEPVGVLGRWEGEIAGGVVGGGLRLGDGAGVVARRRRVVRGRLAGLGGMASLSLSAERVEEVLSGYGGRLSLAAVNGPGSVVVSG